MLIRCLTLSLLLASLPAQADSVWLGGGSFAGQTRVGYLGRVGPLPGKALADGWSQSVVVDYVHYEYDVDNQLIQGQATGIKFSVGRDFRSEAGTLGLSLGAALSRTRLSPDDPGNANRGSSVHPVGELLWQSKAEAAWRSSAYGQYVFGARRNYASAFLGRRLGNGMAIGPQISTGGDPSYRIYGAALALNGWKLGPLDLTIYVGAQHAEGGDTTPEIGFGFSRYLAD